MAIHLDRQRPPKKKMGRKQRKGSKSNPAFGVQWANWLDNPAGAPGGGGGGGGGGGLTLTAVAPTSVVADVTIDLTLTGTGFVNNVTIIYVDGADPGIYPTTVTSPTSATASFNAPVGPHTLSMFDTASSFESSGIPITCTAAEEDAGTQGTPTLSWVKADIIAWIEANIETEGDLQACTKAELLELIEG